MDESYLEWLSSIPGSDLERARRIAERFPTYERLRSATRADLAAIEGMTPSAIDELMGLLGRSTEPDSNHLFLCPNCGSFAGTGSSTCPFCGVEFAGSRESDLAQDLETFLADDGPPPGTCPACGANVPDDATACRVCGRTEGPPKVAQPEAGGGLDKAPPFCPRCGAYRFSDESECAICGTASADASGPSVSAPPVKGVVKDFLTRWQRIAPPGTPASEAERLQEELDHYDRLLEADATLERAWAKRAKVLEKLGRVAEAAESLVKAADLNPSRDDEYRLEVQNLLRPEADSPVLPARWKQPAATAAPTVIDTRLIDALTHYETLLRADPSLVVAWRTKAEILDRLGRPEEAETSRQEADRQELAGEGALRAAVEGLRSSGLSTTGLSSVGFTNGSRTRRTNGRVNGRTNGRANGLGEGRVNGLKTGAVNGLSFARGATNGLVNGNGFTNGRRGRHAEVRIPAQPHWSRSVTGIAAVVALMLVVPILASMLSPSPGAPPSRIQIDGDFSDWTMIPAYADSASDQGRNTGVNLVAFKAVAEDRNLYVNVRVQGLLFRGALPDQTESIFVFVDEDDDPTTGYAIGDIGADSQAEAFGWLEAGTVEHGVVSRRFDASGSAGRNDWARFVAGGSADVAFNGPDLELRMTVDDPARARVLAYAADSAGNRDAADGSIRAPLPALAVRQTTIAPDIAAGRVAFLRIDLEPLGGRPHVSAVNLTRLGNSTDPVDLSLYRDDGSGVPDAGDSLLASVGMAGAQATVPTDLDLESAALLWVEVEWPNATAEATFGLSVSGMASNGTGSFRAREITRVYQVRAPADVRIDGAFGDWRGGVFGQDTLGDVTNRTGAGEYNANVDILATAVHLGANFAGYIRVDGRLLGGQDIPTVRTRTTASDSDTDLDSVPDWIEIPLGPNLARDFNNDNVTDEQGLDDVDADGLPDYPAGADCWLNTTIPVWYPPPYGGRSVARYVCPIGQPPQEGVDVVYAYIDADNDTRTGLWWTAGTVTYGFDFAISVIGRNGVVNSSGLYAHVAAQANPWSFAGDIEFGLDAHRLEFAVDSGRLNLLPGYRIVYFASDWRLGSDVAFPDLAIGPNPSSAQRAGGRIGALATSGGPEALDLSPGETFWLRDTDHATETACTTNKVASTTPGTGPIVSLTLRAGEAACWYLDEASGESIPGGTWETRFDLLLAHGLAVYGEASTNLPRYREWAGPFGAEGSANPTSVVPEWIVLAASPLGPEMILGVLASDQRLYVQTWSGSGWTSNWNVNVGDSKTRRYDIAYEEQSGDVLVVYGDGTSQLKYRKRVSGVWDSASVNAGSPLADTPFFVRSAPRPMNDDVIVGAVTNAQTVHALRWDGASNAWSNQIQMDAQSPASSKDQEVFDIVFERANGDAFVLWGTEASTLRYRRFTTAWQAEAVAYTFADKPLWVVAEYDRRGTAEAIAVAVTLANNNFEFGAWDGNLWVSRPAPVQARDKVQRGMDVAFEATNGRAMFAFNTASNGYQLSWRTWTAASGFSAVSVAPGITASVAIVQLRADPRSDDILALYSDEDKVLHPRLWDGAAWSALGTAIETTLSIHKDKEAFSFAWTRLVEYDVHFEIWNTTSNTVVALVGSCLNRSEYGDDVACSMPNVPAMDLAPDEVVRVRIAHSSPGGSFGILYQDGTSGGTGDSRVLVAIPELQDLVFVVVVPALILAVRARRKRKE